MTIIEALLSITLLFSIRFLWLDLFPISRLLFQNLVFGLYWTVVFAVGMAGGWYAEICIGGTIMYVTPVSMPTPFPIPAVDTLLVGAGFCQGALGV